MSRRSVQDCTTIRRVRQRDVYKYLYNVRRFLQGLAVGVPTGICLVVGFAVLDHQRYEEDRRVLKSSLSLVQADYAQATVALDFCRGKP